MRKILTTFALTISALTIGLVHQASAANLILNNSFESPDLVQLGIPFAFDVGVAYPANIITNWTLTQGTVDLTGACCIPAQNGTQAIDLIGAGFGNGGLSQTFATAIGQTYNLSFWYTHNYGAVANSFSASAVLSGAGTVFSTVVSHNSFANANAPGWTLFSDNFIADALFTTLTFTNLTGAFNGGIYLDNVSVEAVAAPGETPIPGALPLFATGLGALGFLTYRKRRQRSV